MSIYRLYMQNSNCAGFWIQHRTWSNACARVQSIAGHFRGVLPGEPGGEAGPDVLVQRFDVRSGRPVGPAEVLEHPEDRGFALIAEPPWYKRSVEHDAQAIA
jgi:hypothetical protein